RAGLLREKIGPILYQLPPDMTRDWTSKIRDLGVGRREVFAYFDNDAEAQAITDARTLRAERLDGGAEPIQGSVLVYPG
ncbi:MAG: hypothetical protein ACYC7H_14275, partial [Chloroflexota bacterium]